MRFMISLISSFTFYSKEIRAFEGSKALLIHHLHFIEPVQSGEVGAGETLVENYHIVYYIGMRLGIHFSVYTETLLEHPHTNTHAQSPSSKPSLPFS